VVFYPLCDGRRDLLDRFGGQRRTELREASLGRILDKLFVKLDVALIRRYAGCMLRACHWLSLGAHDHVVLSAL
jgi:hypothetical protein